MSRSPIETSASLSDGRGMSVHPLPFGTPHSTQLRSAMRGKSMAVGTGAAGTAMAVPLFQPSGARNPGKPSVILGNGPVRKGM